MIFFTDCLFVIVRFEELLKGNGKCEILETLFMRVNQMALKVFLSSTLRQYVPGYNPLEGTEFSLNRKTTVSELCKLMNIPMATIKIVMVNGKREPFDYELQGDERIGLFPPVGGG